MGQVAAAGRKLWWRMVRLGDDPRGIRCSCNTC
jgi:hypothetical protein